MTTKEVISKLSEFSDEFEDYSFGDLIVALIIDSKLTITDFRHEKNDFFEHCIQSAMENERHD